MKNRMQAAVLARVKPEVILPKVAIIILALVWLLVIQGPAMVGR